MVCRRGCRKGSRISCRLWGWFGSRLLGGPQSWSGGWFGSGLQGWSAGWSGSGLQGWSRGWLKSWIRSGFFCRFHCNRLAHGVSKTTLSGWTFICGAIGAWHRATFIRVVVGSTTEEGTLVATRRIAEACQPSRTVISSVWARNTAHIRSMSERYTTVKRIFGHVKYHRNNW